MHIYMILYDLGNIQSAGLPQDNGEQGISYTQIKLVQTVLHV